MSTAIELIREALAYEAQAFEEDTEIDSGDLVQWFAEWRQRAAKVVEPNSG